MTTGTAQVSSVGRPFFFSCPDSAAAYLPVALIPVGYLHGVLMPQVAIELVSALAAFKQLCLDIYGLPLTECPSLACAAVRIAAL